MRAFIDGKSPLAAITRMEKDIMKPAKVAFKKLYSAPLLEGIDWTMELDPMLRPRNVGELLKIFDTDSSSGVESGLTLMKIDDNFIRFK